MLPGHQPLEPILIPRMPQREHGTPEKQNELRIVDPTVELMAQV